MTAPIDPATDQDDALRIEAGRHLFAQECRFVAGAATLQMLPPASLVEVAFAGRSNVGKSSLINALTNRNTLARTSNTPGRTQQINFFDLGGRLYLVDLPGHGYARASKAKIDIWTDLVNSYLRGRASLRRVLLLVDSRHGLKSSDRDVMDMLDTAAVSYQIVLTKVDKGNKSDIESLITKIKAVLTKRPASHPDVVVTSAIKGYGIDMLRAELATMAEVG